VNSHFVIFNQRSSPVLYSYPKQICDYRKAGLVLYSVTALYRGEKWYRIWSENVDYTSHSHSKMSRQWQFVWRGPGQRFHTMRCGRLSNIFCRLIRRVILFCQTVTWITRRYTERSAEAPTAVDAFICTRGPPYGFIQYVSTAVAFILKTTFYRDLHTVKRESWFQVQQKSN